MPGIRVFLEKRRRTVKGEIRVAAPSFRERLRGFLGLNRTLGTLMGLVVLVGLGEKMAERFLPLYLVALGGSAWAVGALNGLDNLLSALYSLPGGLASDRWGPKRALTLSTLVALGGYLVVILVPTWQAVLVGAVGFIAWTAVTLPAVMGLVSASVPKNKRVMGVSLHSLVRRIPMALGPVVGGVLIGLWGTEKGVRAAFVVALVLGVAALGLLRRFLDDRREEGEPGGVRAALGNLSGDLRSLLVSDILIRFAEQIPYAFVVLWAVQVQGLSAAQFGVLTVIEMATALLVYLPVAALADRYGKKPFVLMTFGFFTAFPLSLLFCHSFGAFALAFVLRGLKEFGEPTRKALIMELAPSGAKAATFGAYYLVRDVVVSVAAFAGAPLWMISPQTNFLVAAACGAVGTATFALHGRDVALPR